MPPVGVPSRGIGPHGPYVPWVTLPRRRGPCQGWNERLGVKAGTGVWASSPRELKPPIATPQASHGRLRRSSGRLLEEAPRLNHEVVKTLVAAVDELTGARHGVLDLLEREER
jgi:hypothetical protein